MKKPKTSPSPNTPPTYKNSRISSPIEKSCRETKNKSYSKLSISPIPLCAKLLERNTNLSKDISRSNNNSNNTSLNYKNSFYKRKNLTPDRYSLSNKNTKLSIHSK